MAIRWPVSVTALDGAASGVRLWKARNARHLTVVVKATFRLEDGARATLVEPEPIVTRDRHYNQSPARSVEAASEVAPFLPRCDVTLRGHAYAPPGQPTPATTARLAIFRGQPLLDKKVFVYGEREVKSPEAPAPFQRMPLDWERALGGRGSKDNPVGRGADRAGAGATPPNVVDPGDPQRSAGLAPISRFWGERTRALGAIARGLVDADEPDIPDGFDYRYFQAAPADQQIGYLTGDEWIVVDGMHPALPRLSSQLPSVRGAALMYEYVGEAYGPATPVKLEADMLQIDTDRGIASVVWRGSVALAPSVQLATLRVFGAVQLEGAPIPWPSPKTLEPPPEPSAPAAASALGDHTRSLSPESHARAASGNPSPFDSSKPFVPPKVAPEPSMGGDTITLQPPVGPPRSPLDVTISSKLDESAVPSIPFLKPPPMPTRPSLDETVKLRLEDAPTGEAMPFKPGDPDAPPPVVPARPWPLRQDPRTDLGGTITLKPGTKPSGDHAPFPITRPRSGGPVSKRSEAIDTSKVPKRESPTVPIFHEPHLTATTAPWQIDPPQDTLTVIAKASFDIVPGGPARLLDEPEPLHGDRFVDDDPEKVLLEATELAVMKPRADVLFSGNAYSIGAGATHARASVKLGDGRAPKGFERTIAIVGDRTWQRSALGPESSPPAPFASMPVVWSRAFGGPGFADNPLGTGHGTPALPNLEDLDALVTSPKDEPRPVCFGPIPTTWPTRKSKLGTYGGDWHKTRFPYFPVDFDPTHFQSAPRPQQVDHLTGKESFEVRGMRPDHPILKGSLAGVRARAFVLETADEGGDFYEVELRADTVHFQLESMQVHVVWRGIVEVVADEAPEIEAVFVMLEDLSSAPTSLDQAKAKLVALASRQAREGAAPPSIVDLPVRKLTDEERAAFKATITRRSAGKEAFDGEDLAGAELIGLDFSGRSLVGVNLKDAVLRGCDFAGASLEGALLAGADLADANLRGAKLDGADLSAAKLDGATLDGAELDSADLSEASANGASFVKCRGAMVQLAGASLVGAKLDGAELPRVDLGRATLDNASFVDAIIPEARLYYAKGERVRFDRAVLDEARGDDSSFVRSTFASARAAASIWEKAILTGSDFSAATLTDASFTRAKCNDASFQGADAKEARFTRASLRSASLRKANLMECDFERADLTNADARGANLHAVETLKAILDGLMLDGALITKTKIVGAAKR